MRQGKVYIKGRYAGLLTEGDNGRYTYVYDDDYLASPMAEAVSLTMPISKKAYSSDVLFPFFSNMLSEGENRKFQSQLLHIDEDDDFGILLATANYDTIGCVTVKPVEAAVDNVNVVIKNQDVKIRNYGVTKADIGKRFRDRRRELKINQQTLADLSGVGINTILAVERGTGNPSLETLQRLTRTLGLEIRIE